MSDDNVPPGILSWEFHLRFFPRLLRDRLRPRKKTGTVFVSHVFMEGMIGVVVCLLLAAWGVPSVLSRGSIFGWVLSILGIGGLAGLVISSVYSQRGSRPSYDNFLSGIFFFFVSLGLCSSLFIPDAYRTAWATVFASAAGLVAGYGLGILAGLWMQFLGWIALIVNMAAGFGAIMMFGTYVVMLFILK